MAKKIVGKNIIGKKTVEKKTIAVCCSMLQKISVLDSIDSICRVANEYGYNVQIFQSFEELENINELNRGEETVFDIINYDEICGLILFGERIKGHEILADIIGKAKTHNVPVVSLDQVHDGCYNITFNYSDAFEEIVRHLTDFHGFKEFFVVAGMKDNAFSDDRVEAVRKVLKERGLILKNENVDYGDFWDIPTIEVMKRFFETHDKLPDAFIALNDSMALVVIDELVKRGYRVPEDTVVTGFDGIYLADTFVPQITTAKQQFDVAGEQAVKIIDGVNKGNRCSDVSIPFKMRIRQSCGCERVDVKSVTVQIKGLHSDFDTCKRFAIYMDQMVRAAIAKGNFEGLLVEAKGYSHFLNNHEHIFLCIKKDYLREEEELYDKLIQGGYITDDSDKDMVLVLQKVNNESDSDSDVIYKEFSHVEILAELKKWQKVFRNMLIVPVHEGDDIFGYMVLEFKQGDKEYYKTKIFTNKISNIMALIKRQSLLRRSNRELLEANNKLERMYMLDFLTNIYNRRGFYQEYPLYLSKKTGGYVSVMSVDLDHLKPINDNYGHNEGDFAIKTLGKCLGELVGDDGIYARFGGDEFVALIHRDRYDKKIAENLYEDIMKLLKGKQEVARKPYTIQCSVGVVQEEYTEDINIEHMLSQSDKLLYEMKSRHHKGEA